MRYILITFATFLDFLKVCFGSFVELEWNGMELIVSISRAKDKIRAGFFCNYRYTQGAKVPRATLATTMFRDSIQLARTN